MTHKQIYLEKVSIMHNAKKLNMDIQILKKKLSDMILEKDNLQDEEIINLSQKLDKLLNELKKIEN